MKRLIAILPGVLIFVISLNSQQVKTPDEFLGYRLGTQFTFHHLAVEYFKYIAGESPYAEFRIYGTSYEGRQLVVCIVSSPENLSVLEELRKNNLIKTGLEEGVYTGKQLPIIWLSYNVHGNESAGMETAMKVLYTLVTRSYPGAEEWLSKCIVIIDPCQNPDGRELYAMRYRASRNNIPNPDPNAWEHNQGWPGARTNHYMIDLNRDWLWQTQIETRQRIALYHQFMPHVHADFHEMSPESTFFFPPSAEPWHEVVTGWQKEFQKETGKANAALFNEKFRLYFTRETYDLFAPNYGDTWPMFNGAVGVTYEQGGSGITGIAYKTSKGDTLSLSTRIEGHFLASIATIKASYENSGKLISEFNNYFLENVKQPPFEYKAVIVKGSNDRAAIESLLELLENNKIKYTFAKPETKKYKGFDYLSNSEGEFIPENGDIIIQASQPMSRLMKVMFEPDSKLTDSLSYDITAWSIPYILNLKTYAVKAELRTAGQQNILTPETQSLPAGIKPYAYLSDFWGFNGIKLMSELFKNDIRIRYSLKPFEMNGKKYRAGTLIIARGDNWHKESDFDIIVKACTEKCRISAESATTGIVDTGKDFGSGYSELKKSPDVAILCGEDISSGATGELWYFMERELEYPVTLINTSYLQNIDLSGYEILVMPPGNYQKFRDKILDYIKNGGRAIAIESAITLFAEEKTTVLYKSVEARNAELKASEKKLKTDDTTFLRKYADERRYTISERSAGSIYRVRIDETHPFTFGLGNEWFIMKRTAGYPFLQGGNNIGYILEKDPVAGFAGYKFRDKIKNTLVIGSEHLGKGTVVYITDDPYYRAFWKSSRVLLGNLIFR